MRTRILGWLVPTVLAVSGWQLRAAEPTWPRELEQIIFEGVQQATEKDLRSALNNDFDLLLPGHPDAPLPDYLRAIEATTLLGYRYSGFPNAKVAARYDEQRERIIVRVEEGPRHVCGEIEISGGRQADAEALAKSLRESAKKGQSLWFENRPVRFDTAATRRIITRLKDAFATQGFFHSQFVAGNHLQGRFHEKH